MTGQAIVSMHIETTRNPKSTCHLLRQSYWEDGKPR